MSYPPKITKYPAAGVVAIGATAVALVPLDSGPREVTEVTLHLSGDPGVVTLTITKNNVNGTPYDTLLKTQAMSGVIDFVWYPSRREILQPGDALDFVMANGTGKTWSLETTMMEVR